MIARSTMITNLMNLFLERNRGKKYYKTWENTWKRFFHEWLMKPVTNDFSHLFTCSSCIKLYWKTKKYNRLSYRPSHSLMVQTKITSNHAIKVKVKKKQSSEFWLVELAYCTRSTILHVHVPVHLHCKSAETWPHTQMFFACMFAHHVLLMGEQRLHNKSRASV